MNKITKIETIAIIFILIIVSVPISNSSYNANDSVGNTINSEYEFNTSLDTITFTLEQPVDINIGNITEIQIIVNISSNSSRIRNETILFARTASYDATAKNASFMCPANPYAPNVIRGHGRNLGYWFEQFNASGTGELGTLGEWSCGALPNSSKFTVLNYGTNWTRVQVSPCSCALFPKFWYLDRKMMMHEDKTDQYSPIYKYNMLKTEFDLTGITPNEYAWNNDWKNSTHHVFFYANATSGSQPLNVWFANSSYTTGKPSESPYCTFLGSTTPGAEYSYSLSNSKYYYITFTSNNGKVGGINLTAQYYFIFTSNADYDDAWKLYYADDNATAGDGYFDFGNTSVAEVSTSNGLSWVPFGNDTIDDKVLRLEFNEGSGDNLVDHSGIFTGHYHNGTRHGATWNASGHEGACLDFNGTTDYVNVSNDPDGHLNFTNEMTVSLWINPANLAPYDYWISKEDSFRFGTSNNKNRPRFGFYRSGWKQESTDSDYLFDGDIWYHVAATFNSTEPETVILYVNGTEVYRQSGFTGTGDMESGFGDIYIGTRYGITAGFAGSIDDVRLWNRSLSPDEMYDVYANVTRKGCPDVNFNVGNPDVDRVIYKFYAEFENGTGGTWSQEWFDVLGDANLPPNTVTAIEPTVNSTLYATDNTTLVMEWLGDPNYDDCWMNTTLEDLDGNFITWFQNRTVTGMEQRATLIYSYYIIPSNYSLTAGGFRWNVTITDNQSASTTTILSPYYITELNITNPYPPDEQEGLSVNIPYFSIDVNHSYGEPFNITWTGANGEPVFNTSYCTSNGTYYAYNTSWVVNFSEEYRWEVHVNETGSTHWLNESFVFETEDNVFDDCVIQPGYTNSTYGHPDFDQKQNENNWRSIFGQWTHCGPTALANCLWWLDCKYNNITKNYRLPDWTGEGSKDPSNVIPLIDWLATYVNTSTPILPNQNSGTSATNMTLGILNLLNVTNTTNAVDLKVEGYKIGDVWDDHNVSYYNITSQLDNNSDVILLLGFWCEYGPAMYGRIGGHYVSVDGYNSERPGLLFADPYKDSAEEGCPGWASTHTHDLYGNGSHNWTHNVSYDYYDISPSTFNPPGWWVVDNYTNDMGNLSANWSRANDYPGAYPCCDPGGICWCNVCTQVLTVIEAAWYIQDGNTCNLSVSKKAWNGTGWDEYYDNPTVGEYINVNFTIYNNGSMIKSLQLMDSYRDAWKYVPGHSYITFSDGTSYAREPNYTTECSGSTCSEAEHGFLYWYLNYSDAGMPLMPGESIWLNSTWIVNNSRYSENDLDVDACLCNDSCMDWMYVNCSYESTARLNPMFNTSIDCSNCQDSDETSDWNLSEHVHRNCTDRECLDQGWMEYETDYTRWYPYDTGFDDWQWVYEYYDANGEGGDSNGLSYTIANDSCSNRSMSALRMRMSYDWLGVGDYEEPSIGIIYSFRNNTNYDMILYGHNKTYLLSKWGDLLVNTEDRTTVNFPGQAYNYYTYEWWCNDSIHGVNIEPEMYGIWVKTIYNEHCGTLQSKAWNISYGGFDMCEECSGWIVNINNHSYFRHDEARGFGLVIWNPENKNSSDLLFYADFDNIDMWRLNYSFDEKANQTQIDNHIYHTGVPLMYFPQFDSEDWAYDYVDWYYNCYTEYFDGNISIEDYRDCSYCFYQNISKKFNLESRAFYPPIDCGAPYQQNDQNDSIYYYTGIVTNMLEEGYLDFNNSLVVEIQDASDGYSDLYDGAIVGIDIDNNLQWDDNDFMFVWYNLTDGTNFSIYKGTEVWKIGQAGVTDCDVYFKTDMADCPFDWKLNYLFGLDNSLPALHRYSNHRIYYLRIPLYHLIKSNGSMLNINDTFGLHVQTINANWANFWNAPDGAPIWENWNESGCTNYSGLTGNTPDNIYNNFNSYLNLSSIYEINSFRDGDFWNGTTGLTNHQYWAHGRIGYETGYMNEEWEFYIQKTANISNVENITQNNSVNYTITVCNNGTLNATNIKVNDTLPPGVVLIDCSLPTENITGADSNWTFNISRWFNGTTCVSFNITVNFTVGCGTNGSTITNFARVYADEPGIDTDTADVIYGTNTAPQIVWQYPVDTSLTTPLLLTNITVVISDANADNMDVYFFTNKSGWGNSTDTWTPVWNAIGTNTTVTNGTYVCNQTFENDPLLNTRWRWGNTYYYWWVNVTDGKTWTNESFWYKTGGSRYDVTTSGDVVFGDAVRAWDYRAGTKPYRGIYDLDASGDVTFTDAIAIWDHRT